MTEPDPVGLVPAHRVRIVEDANRILHLLRQFLDGDKALCEANAPNSFFAVLARQSHERLRICLLGGNVDRLDASIAERDYLRGIWFHASAVINGLVGGEPYGPNSEPCTLKECGEFIFDQLSCFLSHYQTEPATPIQEATESTEIRPIAYVIGWPEILDKLGLQDESERRNQVRRLNGEYDGPIISTGKGSSPRAERTKLISWWNGLEEKWQQQSDENIAAAEDAKATVAASHDYGREGTVLPDIAGSVKKQKGNKT